MQSEPETSIVYLTSNLGLWRELQLHVADLAATGITDCVQMGVEVGAGRDCRCRIISGTDVLLYRVLVEYRSPSV